ncbi:MAG: 6,7-dimethyl-8-ribityllumazine synthase [Nitrospinaceae bacterium]|nr:6,7-dimethyl-8-ribityllumazine synthase [Nitrospinaceae bacterium]NIR57178.1 6,7-dimethyl-8-ribityllumazine synthase [Nitrospinaceae bacterium]NIS87620.1 6,7-dimethyl-8-ribityllumazine synthase [Nitrospinaceae bacterium]NIT84491.1 6,7-dimethyl-8-ribityllumazine synthase [Nitrospinaceae bacterium]NIU46677.1 6,7-dimethyl-8-ribityllumazine synthase [Nitrospinaceae bacterium]
MTKAIEGDLNGEGHRIGIVVSRFNDFITGRLVDGAVDCLVRHGVKEDDIEIVKVPGAFEIPMAARRMVDRNKYDAILCLGAVVRGATPHFEYVAGEAAKGIGSLAMSASIPVLFGVLTTDNLEQAIERAGAKSGNKGWETALAAIEMINVYKQL